MKVEHIIRDWLLQHPDFIEEGLQVIEKEFYLPDDIGSSGFIDILCKDLYNNFVIVEIKRSDAAARQTFTEVFKYAALIKKQYNARDSEIRIVILSTHWDELIRAFSLAWLTSSFALTGLQIYLDDQTMQPVHKEEIEPVVSKNYARKFMTTQVLYLFHSREERENAHDILKQRLEKGGVNDYVTIYLDAPADKILDYYYVINAAFQKRTIEEIVDSIALLEGEQHLDMKQEEFDEAAEYAGYLEQVFLCALEMNDYISSQDVGYAEKFESMTGDQQWNVTLINRSGIFDKDPRYTTELLLKELKGHDGNSANKFVGFSASTQKERLKEIRNESQYCLGHTPIWAEFIDYILAGLEQRAGKFRMVIDIYNPDSIVTALYFALTKANALYLPLFRLLIYDEGTGSIEGYIGEVRGNGTSPSSKLFTVISEQDIASEVMRLHLLPDNEMDAFRMGLAYTILKTVFTRDENISEQFVELDEGAIIADASSYIPIEDYIKTTQELLSLMIYNYERVYQQF